MPGRRIPSEILSFLGPCREAESATEKIVEQCGLAKLMGEGLTDNDPLIVVMNLVAVEVRGLGLSLYEPEGRKTWCEAMHELQGNYYLEHNTLLPCHRCDQAFEPVIDEALLTLFLSWFKKQSTKTLLSIHLCPACGGQLAAKRTKQYKGDYHTPAPGSCSSGEDWAETLLQYSHF